MFEQLTSYTPYLSGAEISLSILTAFVLGLFVAWVYRATVKGGLPSRMLIHTLIMLAMITALVMMAIGDSIARAFSLVGALSIIRFRTVVKDNRDTAFVFFALAAGIACGAGSYTIATVGTFTIGFLVLLIARANFGQNGQQDFLLKLRVQPDDSNRPVYEPVFENHLASSSLLHVRSLQLGNLLEMSYQIRLKSDSSDRAFVSELSTQEGVERVSIISSEEDDPL